MKKTKADAGSTDQLFMELYQTKGVAGTAEQLGIYPSTVSRRRRVMERKYGFKLEPPPFSLKKRPKMYNQVEEAVASSLSHPQRIPLEAHNGIILVGSDMHYWPGEASPAHRGMVALAKELKPSVIIANGDVIDGSTVSRHAPIGWENRPHLVDEIEAAQERLAELKAAAPKARRVWPLGNHDARFETRLAMVAPEYAKVKGVHLYDHFPDWEPCWSTWINNDVVVKHRFKGGVHAAHNNTLLSGKTIVTGHLHSLKVTPFTDYNGTRWGVETGTLADPDGPQFVDYTEDGPKNWVSGFAVLEFYKGRLLWPDVAYVIDSQHIGFRGKVIKV